MSVINTLNRSSPSQRGVALIVSMVLLVVITLIGVTVMSGSRLEWLMVNNSFTQSDALTRAEAALRDGEARAVALGDPAVFSGWATADELFSVADPLAFNPRTPTNWSGSSPAIANAADATTIKPSKYIVEYMGCSVVGGGNCLLVCPTATCVDTYRIWAYSSDENDKGSTRIVQSTFIRTVISGGAPTFSRIGYAEIYNDQAP